MSALQDQPVNTSFLSPIGFKFQLNNFPAVNYFCQSASLPGISISSISVPTPLKAIDIAGDEVAFEELSIKFIVDENMKNWLSIYDWIIGLGFPTEEGQAKYKKLSENKTRKNISIVSLFLEKYFFISSKKMMKMISV